MYIIHNLVFCQKLNEKYMYIACENEYKNIKKVCRIAYRD